MDHHRDIPEIRQDRMETAEGGQGVYETLVSAGYQVSLRGFSALDQYLGLAPLPFTWLETDADITALARFFDCLRFPGVDLADGALEAGGRSWYFRCLDREETPSSGGAEGPAFTLLSLNQDWSTRRFRDPCGVYPIIRRLRGGTAPPGEKLRWMTPRPGTDCYRAAMEGALILARYGMEEGRCLGEIVPVIRDLPRGLAPGTESQRVLLTGLLLSPRPDLGMELLKGCGFIDEFWPEFSILDDVDHSKEFHPEGNVWKHTMETFRYRKPAARGGRAYDLRLSLGLLFHDTGKPLSEASGSRRFDGHAELGARVAQKFLERLAFEPSLIGDTVYLVKNHMLPAALPRLPLARTEKIMVSPLFPTLMELYRCDESSSFKGLDAYYESSAAYQAYLRYRRNPYRSADGKKLAVRGRLGY
ncbi:MAG: HD domain-containing protein [Spirochaetaceae bacterium]|jgi:poly(A) polymerase|nr:HD domain-containing protein [Spirochaetaceae bacterium]